MVGRVARALVLALGTLVLGGVVGLASVVVHEWWPMLAVSVLTLLAVVLALPRAWWSRPPFVAGFAVVVSLAMLPRPEGDYLIGSDGPGYTLLGVTVVLVIATVVTLPRPGPRPARPTAPPTDSLR